MHIKKCERSGKSVSDKMSLLDESERLVIILEEGVSLLPGGIRGRDLVSRYKNQCTRCLSTLRDTLRLRLTTAVKRRCLSLIGMYV